MNITTYISRLFLIILLSNSPMVFALQNIDSIAVVVDNDVITTQDLSQRINEIKLQIRNQGKALPSDKILRKQVLERMILDNVQMQLAKAQGIQIDDVRLNKILNSIAASNKISIDDMRRQLESEGISFERFREQTRKDIILRQLQQRMVNDRIKVSDQEIDYFLKQQEGTNSNEQYHLAHILIGTPEAAAPADIQKALNKAEDILLQLKNGADFRQMALKYSEGRQALQGGDLGWRKASELPYLFVRAIAHLNTGEISAPLRSAGGFHILKLLDKKSQKHLVEQTHARHILIKSDAITSDEAARKKLTDIKKRLDQGEDFAKLAAEFSQDPGSKNNGGDLGWASKGNFVPRFEQVMDSLKEGQISEPFRSQFGWHILQVLKRRQQDETQKIKRANARKAISKRKADEALQLWLRRIRSEVYVEYKKPMLEK